MKTKEKSIQERIKSNLKRPFSVLFLLLLIVALGFALTFPEQMTFYKKTTVSGDVNGNEIETLKMGSGEWRQELYPKGIELSSISFEVYDVPKDAAGSMDIAVLDGNGKQLYEKQIPMENLWDGTYYAIDSYTLVRLEEMDIPVALAKSPYCLRIKMTGQQGDTPSLKIRMLNQNNTTNEGKLTIDGVEKEGNLYIATQGYLLHYENYYALFALVLFALALCGYVTTKSKYRKGIGVLLSFALPGVVCLLFWWVNIGTDSLDSQALIKNMLLVYAIYGVLFGMLGRRVGGSLLVVASFLIAIANYYVRLFRGQALSFADFLSLKTAATVVGAYEFIVQGRFVCVFILTTAILYLLWNTDAIGFERKRNNLIAHGALFAGSIVGISILYGNLPVSVSSWDIQSTYQSAGWLNTNLMLLKSSSLDKPAGYVQAEVEKALDAVPYEPLQQKTVPTNLIVIMDEAFSDLSVFGDLELNQDEMPFLRSLEETSPEGTVEKGFVSVPVLGGNTCYTEWEVLTGGIVKLLNVGNIAPYNVFYNKRNRYSTAGLCQTAGEAGYATVAMHPYGAKNYGRDNVYSYLGFDHFLSIENCYEEAEYLRWCVSDKSDFEEIIEQYKNKENDKLFLFNVTMQNHGGYSDPWDLNIDVHSAAFASEQLDTYLSLVKQTDASLKNLIDYFAQVDEPTMIVFFGDHQPSMSDEFYNLFFGTTEPSGIQKEKMYVTPYFIWSNYQRETKNVPYLSANFLQAYIKEAAGFALSAFDSYALNYMQQIPVIGRMGIFDRDYAFTEYGNMAEDQMLALEEMEDAQYYYLTQAG